MEDSITVSTDTLPGDARDGRAVVRHAAAAAAAVRAVNHLTIVPASGYGEAADVYSVLGNVRDLAHGLGQALGQAARWIAQAEADGRLLDVEQPDPAGTRRTAVEAVTTLANAAGYAASLGSDVAAAHSAVGRLATNDGWDLPVPYVAADRSEAR